MNWVLAQLDGACDGAEQAAIWLFYMVQGKKPPKKKGGGGGALKLPKASPPPKQQPPNAWKQGFPYSPNTRTSIQAQDKQMPVHWEQSEKCAGPGEQSADREEVTCTDCAAEIDDANEQEEQDGQNNGDDGGDGGGETGAA